MGVVKRSSSSKPKVKAAKVTAIKTKSKAVKSSKVSTAVRSGIKGAVGGAVRSIPVVGGALGGMIDSGALSSLRSKGGRRHRKGTVPKSVRKWIRKTVRRQKTIEKSIGKLLRVSGAKKYHSKHMRSGYYYGGSTPGVITRSEANEAFRR